MPVTRQLNQDDGQVYIVSRDDDGRVIDAWPDPGAFRAEDQAFQRRMGDFGRTIAGLLPEGPDAGTDRAREWARSEPYYDALRQEYPIATGIGEFVAEAPTLAVGGGQRQLGQFAANVGMPMAAEALRYDPLRESSELGQTAINAAAGHVGGTALGRIWTGATAMANNVRQRGLKAAFSNALPEASQNLTDRGYKLSRPSQMVDREHPLRGVMERMEMGSESGALPSRVMAENTDYNRKRLNNTFARALGLKGKWDYIDEGVLAAAAESQQKVYKDLGERMPSTVELDERVANRLLSQPWVKDIVRDDLDVLPDVKRYANDVARWDGQGPGPDLPVISSKDFFDIRSDLTKQAANADTGIQTEGIGKIIDELDSAVTSQIDDAGWVDDFAKAREQWEVYYAAQRPGVIGKEGQINPLALARSMASESNFGRSALYGQEGQFTNEATADLAGDVAALVKPETYANSRTADRNSWLKFATSIADDPLYAAATAGNTAMVNTLLNQAENGGAIGDMATQFLAGTASDIPNYLMGVGTGAPILPAVGSRAATAPEGINPTGSMFDYLQNGIMPSAEERDAALYPFVGAEDERER